MTRIKLCGMMRESDMQAVNQIRPYYCGFVFAPGSPRCVTPRAAASLIRGLSRGITPVGVFRGEDAARIAECCRISGVRMVQIHGEYADGDVRAIRDATGLPVIRAFGMTSEADAEAARRSSADLVLLDNGPGGTGTRFDPALAEGIGRDFVLAGGLDPGNVAGAVKALRPFAVDVSSGIETDGVKDPLKMKAFADAVREADYESEEEE